MKFKHSLGENQNEYAIQKSLVDLKLHMILVAQ